MIRKRPPDSPGPHPREKPPRDAVDVRRTLLHHSLRFPTLLTTYCRTRFCSSPPTPSISSGVSPSEFVCINRISLSWLAQLHLAIGKTRHAPVLDPLLLLSRLPPHPHARSPLPNEVVCSLYSSSAAISFCPPHTGLGSPARSAPFKRVFGRPSGG